MISFELSEDQAIAWPMFEQLAKSIVGPEAEHNDRTGIISPAVLHALWQAGLLQSMAHNDDGAMQPSRLLNCLLLEELGATDTSVALLVAAGIGYVQAIVEQGSDAQIAELNTLLEAAEPSFGAVLMLEPGLGWELNRISSEVVAVEGGFRLSGAKTFCPYLCDNLVVLAKFEGAIGAFVVNKGMPGVVSKQVLPTLGLRGLGFHELRFDDVILPPDARLGGNNGVDVQRLASAARLGACAIQTGLSRAVFEYVTPYTKERVAHGSPLAQKQSVAFRLADMAIDIPAMRWATWRGATVIEKGRDAAREARLAQIYCASKAFAIADEGVQLLGGHGYMQENPVERWYRDARTLSLLEGVAGI